MTVRNSPLVSILAKKLEKKGFENKGYMDMQADEMVLYAALHDAEWGYAEDRVWMELVTRLPCWAWKKWFFTNEWGLPVFVCFKKRREPRANPVRKRERPIMRMVVDRRSEDLELLHDLERIVLALEKVAAQMEAEASEKEAEEFRHLATRARQRATTFELLLANEMDDLR